MSQTLPRSFDQLISRSDRPVLVDFWAPWCGPCRMLAPVVQQLAREYRGRLLTVKINIDEKPDVAARHGVQSVPTLILFAGGREVERLVGAQPYEVLRQRIEAALSMATV